MAVEHKYGLELQTIEEIKGPLLIVKGIGRARYNELVEVTLPDGRTVLGTVLESTREYALVQVFGDPQGLSKEARVRFTGEVIKIPVSEDVIGRIFNGSFKPLDGLPEIMGDEEREIFFSVINPAKRLPPSEFIQTGVSIIDALFSLVRGQKLPIFSEAGLPHNVLAAQIARQATILKKGEEIREEFIVVFCAMGIKHEEYAYFRNEFEKTGALNRAVLILNLAEDPVIERIIAPRIALTVAEYLAFELDYHVLVILTDMTAYAEAVRQVAIAREEVPARRGYPGWLYTDLATIYERAGRVSGKRGSVTLMPILTMPAGDITHPVPDLSGYITEGQIILSKELYAKGIYPPVDVPPSLSRLMKSGIGPGKTREDHKYVADELYRAYSEGLKARDLARIVGTVGLSERERKYLEFAEVFERKFINQGIYENRPIDYTLDLAWEVLSVLPEDELIRIPEDVKRKWHPKYRRRVVVE